MTVKDYVGQILQLEDYVAYKSPDGQGLRVGVVYKITPKMIFIRVSPVRDYKQFHNQVIKITKEQYEFVKGDEI